MEEIENIVSKSKLLLKYKKDLENSSIARFNTWINCTRAKMTTLNAKLQRDAECFEILKQELKLLIKNI